MSYCYDMIKKFRKEGNFCGLDKSEVSRLEAYLEIVDLLMKQHLEEKDIVEKFPLGAARVLIPIKDERRGNGLSFVTERLKEGSRVTAKDLKEKLEISNQKVKPSSAIDEKKEPSPPGTDTKPFDPCGEGCPDCPTECRVETTLSKPPAQEQEIVTFVTPFVRASQLDKVQDQGIVAASLATDPKPDPAKEAREKMEYHATELIKLFSPQVQQIVRDVMEYHNSYKAKDVIYYALQMYGEHRKKW